MSNKTTRILWILISITVTLLVITGTLLLFYTQKENFSSSANLADNDKYMDAMNETLEIANNQTNVNININTTPSDVTIEEANIPAETPIEVNITESKPASSEKELPAVKAIFVESKQVQEEPKVAPTPTQKEPSKVVVAKKPTPVAKETKKVEAKPSKPAPKKTPPKPVVKKYTIKHFWIQVGSFSLLSTAEAQQSIIKKMGLQSTISTTQSKGNTLYRLRIGPFTQKDEAQHYLSQLSETKSYSGSYITETTSTITK